MIHGIGTDIVDVRRIAAALQRHGERFAQRVLGDQEMKIFQARRARIEQRGISFLATRFSAKEAFAKAVGLGLRTPMSWRACEIVNVASGQPVIRLHGELAEWFAQRKLQALVSLSDEADYAAAFVIVQTLEPSP